MGNSIRYVIHRLLKIVYEYICQLQKLGKYDDATIIITADHGHNQGIYDDGNVTEVSVPILFVKRPGDCSDSIIVSDAPVAQEDIMPTIKYEASIGDGENTIFDIDDEDRTRFFRICDGDENKKFEINGDVRDISSWKLVE